MWGTWLLTEQKVWSRDESAQVGMKAKTFMGPNSFLTYRNFSKYPSKSWRQNAVYLLQSHDTTKHMAVGMKRSIDIWQAVPKRLIMNKGLSGNLPTTVSSGISTTPTTQACIPISPDTQYQAKAKDSHRLEIYFKNAGYCPVEWKIKI